MSLSHIRTVPPTKTNNKSNRGSFIILIPKMSLSHIRTVPPIRFLAFLLFSTHPSRQRQGGDRLRLVGRGSCTSCTSLCADYALINRRQPPWTNLDHFQNHSHHSHNYHYVPIIPRLTDSNRPGPTKIIIFNIILILIILIIIVILIVCKLCPD